MDPHTRRSALPLTGPILRISLVAVLVTSVAAQTKPSGQKKSDGATKSGTRAAEVTYTGGQLSVVANNNSLTETLAEIRELTKARVEGVQPGPSERISGEFGPDTPRAVVGALLASSHYNFILVSPPGNPGSLQRIVLSEPAPEPVAAEQPVAPAPSLPEPSSVTQPAEIADHPAESAGKEDATTDADHSEAAVAEKDASSSASESSPAKEKKPESTTSVSEPTHETAGNQPNVPPTVEICGVTYTAAQLADLRVPDHCGKPAPQPNSTSGSKQSN